MVSSPSPCVDVILTTLVKVLPSSDNDILSLNVTPGAVHRSRRNQHGPLPGGRARHRRAIDIDDCRFAVGRHFARDDPVRSSAALFLHDRDIGFGMRDLAYERGGRRDGAIVALGCIHFPLAGEVRFMGYRGCAGHHGDRHEGE